MVFSVDNDDDTPNDAEREKPTQAFLPERRDGKWFAVDTLRGIELAPVFDTRGTANEVGRKCGEAEAFFANIPTVTHQTPFPRPSGVEAKPNRSLGVRRQGRGRVVSHRPNG